MSIKFNEKEHIWVERYRPQTIDDCILQERTKSEIKSIVKDGKIPNLLFYGPAGCGKTSLARAICIESDVDWIIINGSNERGIDVVREKIVSFASTASLSGNNHKVVIIDESDRLSSLAQDALKAELERFSKSCSFIFTANHPNRLIDPLHSRLVGVNFVPTQEETELIQAQIFVRLCEILENENVTYNETVLIEVIGRYFPDTRKIIGELQQYSRASNDINEGMLMHIVQADAGSLVNLIVKKKFKDIAQWIEDNANNGSSDLYHSVYVNIKDKLELKSIPDAILILEDYQRYDAIVPSKELHLTAMAVELMSTLEFK